MTHSYNISGMTCGSCVAKIKSALLKLGEVTDAEVQLAAPQATISMSRHLSPETLQSAIRAAGDFTISEVNDKPGVNVTDNTSWFATYKPILLIFAYITGITTLLQFSNEAFDGETFMRHFMAAFFLVFSFFKLLDLTAFAVAYSSYDIIAKKWNGWGYLYPFVELALGIAFLLGLNPLVTNGVAFVVMTLSIIGVLQTTISKRKIQCACLGTVFKLPMSTITIIEDGLMIVMSAWMLSSIMF